MLIPKDISNRKLKEGDIVILTEDIELDYLTITKGHEMIFLRKDNHGSVLKEYHTGLIVKGNNNNFTRKVTFSEAKNIRKKVKDKRKFIKFIDDKCPHKGYTYEDRDKVDICELKNEETKYRYNWKYCKPCIDCIEHIPKDKYKNNSFIINYIRKLKLKKFKKTTIENEQK